MYQVLARKWRSKQFEAVVGQAPIVRSLQNALKRDQIGHAYLFTGTRGIGKTTVARLLAKTLCCEAPLEKTNPCMQCKACLQVESGNSFNVIEMDGASHNSVDDVRSLIENVQYLPTQGFHKVYIIDEVHMLSKEAFNALLKTLEEPPRHVVFIFATTHPEKLPSTVLSRCQRFDFRQASLSDLVSHLSRVLKEEGYDVGNPVLVEQIALQAQGSFRDSLSLLDQVLAYTEAKRIDEKTVSQALGLVGKSAVEALAKAILAAQADTSSQLFRDILADNVELKSISLSLLDVFYRLISTADRRQGLDGSLLSLAQQAAPAELFWIYETLVQDLDWAMSSLAPNSSVEVVIRKICLRHDFFQSKPVPIQSKVAEETTAVEPIVEAQPQAQTPYVQETVDEVQAEVLEPASETEGLAQEESVEEELGLETPEKSWEAFLAFLYSKSPATAANLEQGNTIDQPIFNDEQLLLRLGFDRSAKVFWEHVCEPSVKQKILRHLSQYFRVEEDAIQFEIKLLGEEEKSQTGFQSQTEIRQQAEAEQIQKREKELLDSVMIQRAQELFGKQVDKVVLNDL